MLEGLEIKVEGEGDIMRVTPPTVRQDLLEEEDYVEEIDCLMIGPHLKSIVPDMEEVCAGYPIKIGVVDKDAYAHLNGEKALDQILAMFGE